jgi:hypothetical protein
MFPLLLGPRDSTFSLQNTNFYRAETIRALSRAKRDMYLRRLYRADRALSRETRSRGRNRVVSRTFTVIALLRGKLLERILLKVLHLTTRRWAVSIHRAAE